MRALVVAHGHPDFGAGGGEIAAHALFAALREHPGVGNADFLARTAEPRLPQGGVGRLREGEYLIRRDIADWPLLEARPDAAPAGRGLMDFLRARRPDVVFLHHVAHLGLDIMSEIRGALPDARLALTLHDYLPICLNAGLMARTEASGAAGAPCAAASPDGCHRCFPEHAPALFEVRRRRFLEAFAPVDRFVAPSRFLAGRFLAFGLHPERLRVAANGVAPPAVPCPPPAAEGGPLRLGLFGQARPEKGLHVALAALHHLAPAERALVRLEAHVSRLEAQAPWYRALVGRLAAPLEGEGALLWRGAYGRDALAGRMGGVDAVLAPSTWVENAPLVVGEAFAHGRPVIGARLGGIAEMVAEERDGLLFEPGDARDLAATIRRLLAEPSLAARLAAGTRPPPTPRDMAAAYLALLN